MVQVHLYLKLMLKKIIRSKSASRNKSFILWKLKKKWRFWRVFRFYFLKSKKKNFFPKINWLFNQRRIIWHQLAVMYGKKIKNQAYTNHKSKVIFDSKFGSVLCKLELRLNILMVRMGFVNKLQQSDVLISNSKVIVNTSVKHKRYSVRTGDLISFRISSLKLRDLKRFEKLRWRKLKWKNWKKKSIIKKFRRIYFLLKKSFILNFMEINYQYYFSILLRYPMLGEISYRNKKRLLTSRLLQKIYFLY